MFRFCYVLFGLLLSLPLFGSVSDSGGKIQKWAMNPWYLENTKDVSYCIHLSDDFGGSIHFYKLLIRSSFESWKEMFNVAHDSEGDFRFLKPYKSLKVATQKFVERCDEDTDIRFMLAVLTEQQREKFTSPRDFVGAAIRTHYDKVNLRSKGFVYIAPLSGPLKPKIEGLPDLKWNSDSLAPTFQVLLDHELGHVFGLNHGSGYFMKQNLPEKVISWLADTEKKSKPKQQIMVGP